MGEVVRFHVREGVVEKVKQRFEQAREDERVPYWSGNIEADAHCDYEIAALKEQVDLWERMQRCTLERVKRSDGDWDYFLIKKIPAWLRALY